MIFFFFFVFFFPLKKESETVENFYVFVKQEFCLKKKIISHCAKYIQYTLL